MALPTILSKFAIEKKEEPEPFLALEISHHFVKSAIWQVSESKTQLISFGGVENWDGQDLDELVVLADASIAKAVELQEKEPHQVLFGLPETWVDADKIVPPRLRELRQLSAKLDLKPLGFVVTTEAVVSYLKILEGVPLNAILVRLLESEVAISLIKGGKLQGTQVVGRSEELGADVYEGLGRFGQKEGLPPRILVFNADSSLEKEEQSLISFDWGRLFLHFPRVEVLDKEFSIKAVAIAGGWEVAKAQGLVAQSRKLFRQEPEQLVQKVEEEIKEESAQSLGFVIDQDIQSKKVKKEEVTSPPPPVTPAVEKPTKPVKKTKKIFSFPQFSFGLLKNVLFSLFKIPQKLFRRLTLKWQFSFSLVFLVLFLALLIGSAFAFYWYALSAQVTLFVKAKNFSDEVKIIVDPDSSSIDFDQFILPGQKVNATVSQSAEIPVTGEKVVGDKAKGEVTLYNKTFESQSFPEGTVLIGPEGLEFLTDAKAEIASASAEEKEGGQVITYGKQKVSVTAADIGPDYNLEAGKEFNPEGFSTDAYYAKNEAAFSGGTSRKIKVVAEEDEEKLLQELSEKLKKEAANNLRDKMSSNQELFEEGIAIEIVSQKFDKETGEETENLKLDLEVKAETLTFSHQDLKDLLLKQIEATIPQGYQLQESATKIGIKESEFKDGQIKFKGTVDAKLTTQSDLEKIKEEIKGKYPQVTQEYFESLPGFKKVEIEIRPTFLPARLKTFPRKTEKINIETEVVD